MLHITNGDIAAQLVEATGIPGTVLPWRDVLHEGPVPAGLGLQELGEVRAHFLFERGWAQSSEEALREFRERDTTLQAGLAEDEIVLWFEADLYDQLQILQILEWIGQHERPLLSLICIGAFPGIDQFTGLGQLTPSQLGELFPARRRVNQKQVELATRAWQAFTSPGPQLVNRLVFSDTAALEFLGPALIRLLELYPLTTNGLDRTERQVLQVLSSGSMSFAELFPKVQALEERPFLGDSTLWSRLLALGGGPEPAVRIAPHDLSITSFGRACFQGGADFIQANGIDRWIGGVHLTRDSPWRWDPRARQVGEYTTNFE
jgi:hypothetical protein